MGGGRLPSWPDLPRHHPVEHHRGHAEAAPTRNGRRDFINQNSMGQFGGGSDALGRCGEMIAAAYPTEIRSMR
jgi:hypothetical protein